MKFKYKDYSNIIINDRKVLKYSHTKKSLHYWFIECKCGKIEILAINNFIQRKSKYCWSCSNKRSRSKRIERINNNELALRIVYKSYKNNSRIKNRKFDLTLKEFESVTSQKCFYCDKPPFRIKIIKDCQYTYNGIDRIDNSKGYELNNIVTCCRVCNNKKSDISVKMIKRMYKLINGYTPKYVTKIFSNRNLHLKKNKGLLEGIINEKTSLV